MPPQIYRHNRVPALREMLPESLEDAAMLSNAMYADDALCLYRAPAM
jgi:hypothetical protein